MNKKKVDRINELGRLSKARELTQDERAEQAALRAEYIAEFRALIRGEKPPVTCDDEMTENDTAYDVPTDGGEEEKKEKKTSYL